TAGDPREMAAEIIRIAPGKQWSASVPRGCDGYLFVLAGTPAVSAHGARHPLGADSFVTLQEGSAFVVANDGRGRADVLHVLAPPPAGGSRPNGHGLAGFAAKINVTAREGAPRVDLPAEKKQRIYFVDDAAARSQRGHAMIVVYGPDTVTGLHHHPNAESLFVVLTGALTFTVNGAAATVEPGQAAYFGCDDPHGLRVADGLSGASFLEFHIPAAYTTVKHG